VHAGEASQAQEQGRDVQSALHASEIAQSTQQSQQLFRGKVISRARIVAHVRRILSRKGKEKAQEPSLIIAIKVDGDGMERSLGKAEPKAERSAHTSNTAHGSQRTQHGQQSTEQSQRSF
jgi:hypothetical protein